MAKNLKGKPLYFSIHWQRNEELFENFYVPPDIRLNKIEDNLPHHIILQNRTCPRGVRLSGLEVGVTDTSDTYISSNTLNYNTTMTKSLKVFKFEWIWDKIKFSIMFPIEFSTKWPFFTMGLKIWVASRAPPHHWAMQMRGCSEQSIRHTTISYRRVNLSTYMLE